MGTQIEAICPATTTSAILGTDAATAFDAGELVYFTDTKELWSSNGDGTFVWLGGGKAYIVSGLPAAGYAGRKAWVTDALTPVFAAALTGGSSTVCPVFDNGTAWVAG